MSMDVFECERCLAILHTYSGEHLCKTCAELTERSTYDPWWGDFPSHPDARLNAEPLSELKRTGTGGWL
jgi:hypothetical protein